MKKNLLTISCAVAMLLPGMQSAMAESVAVKGDVIFIVDNSVTGSQIVVKFLLGGVPNTCLANPNLGLVDTVVATDIVIKNGTAVITTYNNTTRATDVKLVDVTSCLTTVTDELSKCYASVSGGKLTIPCLNYGGDIISVVLGQRGSSMNFEFESYKPNKHPEDGED
ncbi:MAG: hypothetical protein IPI17_09065 [Nitrosomonas sp.]|jgi:hypothetical protein|nr:hypothetical protein [Nitrosomonas sp.]